MTMASVNRAPRPSSLADVLDVVLDKGIVIDAYVRVAVVGIELLTIDARIVIASVDTYLRFAEAVNRLDIQPQDQVAGLPGLMNELTEGGARSKTKGALTGAKEKAQDVISSLTGRGTEEEGAEDEDAEDAGGGNGRADRGVPASRRPRSRS
jgi:gas vesicle structural protein